MLVREEIHEVDTSYSIPAMFLKLRCEELRKHKEKTLEAWKSRMEARNTRASRAGSLTGRVPTTKYKSEEDPVPDESFRVSYIEAIDRMIQRYENLSARYEHRYRYCVPFRASKQKARPEWIRAVPLNLHLSMLSVSKYRSGGIDGDQEEEEEEKVTEEEEEDIPVTPPPPPTPASSEMSKSISNRKNSLPRKIFVKLPRIGASLGVQYSNNLTVIKVEQSTEAKYGIRVGQRILAVNNRPVATVRQLQKAVMSAGLNFELTVASLPVEYVVFEREA